MAVNKLFCRSMGPVICALFMGIFWLDARPVVPETLTLHTATQFQTIRVWRSYQSAGMAAYRIRFMVTLRVPE